MTYVYCIVRAARKPATGRAPEGLPGAAAPRVRGAGRSTWLVVADVPPRQYGSAAIDRGLKDLEWVAPRALAHEAVVEHFARRADVVPMKLFTIFNTDDRAVRHVTANADLPRIFRHIAGASEWSVRLTAASNPSNPSNPSNRSTSGAAFLRRKQSERDAARAAAAEAGRLAGRVYGALSRLAKDGVRKDTSVPGATVLLDAAFLVPRARQAAFLAAVKRLAREAGAIGSEIVVSGPWPPYHFVAAPPGRRARAGRRTARGAS